MISLLLDFSPVGRTKGILEAILGRDLITGDKLAWWERLLNLIPGGRTASRASRAGDVAESANAVNRTVNPELLPSKIGLEPGAIPGDIGKRRLPTKDLDPPPGWSEKYRLKPDDIVTFADTPIADTLPPGTKIYRIIGQTNNPSGSYWSLEPPPLTEAEWRAGWAVKNKWNGDGGYVEHTVGSEGLPVWRGEAAPQIASRTQRNHILPGGKEQLWIPPNTIKVSPPKRTPWNR